MAAITITIPVVDETITWKALSNNGAAIQGAETQEQASKRVLQEKIRAMVKTWESDDASKTATSPIVERNITVT